MIADASLRVTWHSPSCALQKGRHVQLSTDFAPDSVALPFRALALKTTRFCLNSKTKSEQNRTKLVSKAKGLQYPAHPMFFLCSPHVLPVFFLCSPSVLPVFSPCSSHVLPVFFPCSPHVFLVFSSCSLHVFPVVFTGRPSVLPLFPP